MPGDTRSLQVRASSKDQGAIGIVGWFAAHMFDSRAPIGAEPVEAEAVQLFVNLVDKPSAQNCPLCGVNLAFEHRVLYALTEILAEARDTTQAPSPVDIAGGYIIGNQHQHGRNLTPEKGRVAVDVAAQLSRQQIGLHVWHETECRSFFEERVRQFILFSLLVCYQYYFPRVIA